jgi:transcriptional regulator with XRE-family HTH domain
MVDLMEDDPITVGERLRLAREEQGLSLDDIAARTRIPTRHLESIEQSEWSRMPAPTYTIGFAKSYGAALGLDKVEIGDALRLEMGGRPKTTAETQVFEPADPARVMPVWLVLGAILAVLAVVGGLMYMRSRSLSGDDAQTTAAADAPLATAPVAAAGPATVAPSGPVSIIANEPVWIQVYEKAGPVLKAGELRAGERYDVPATATAPMLKTGKPEALRIAVGTADAPPVGPPATTVKDVSLLGADLMHGNGSAGAAPDTAALPAQ